MKKIISFSFLPLFLVICSCNKQTFIESVGHVLLADADDTDVGYFIFTSENAIDKCGEVSIYIDDKFVGKLTKDYRGKPVSDCIVNPIEGELLKVVVTAGNHQIKAKFHGNCGTESTDTRLLERGKCWRYTISTDR